MSRKCISVRCSSLGERVCDKKRISENKTTDFKIKPDTFFITTGTILSHFSHRFISVVTKKNTYTLAISPLLKWIHNAAIKHGVVDNHIKMVVKTKTLLILL